MANISELYTVSVDISETEWHTDVPTILIARTMPSDGSTTVVRTLRGGEALDFRDKYLRTTEEKMNDLTEQLKKVAQAGKNLQLGIYSYAGMMKEFEEGVENNGKF